MGKSSKVIDLVASEDGTFEPKQTKGSNNTAIAKTHKHKENKHRGTGTAPADEFLAGIDAGLDFVDAVKIRALRIMGMRD